MLPSSLRARLALAGGVVVLLAALGAGAYLIFGRPPGDVSHPNVEFQAPKVHKAKKAKPARNLGRDWPIYGRTPGRTQATDLTIHPPFKKLWEVGGKSRSLLEFAPIAARGRLFIVNNEARGSAFDARTGRRIWTRKLGTLAASSFGYWNKRVYFAPMSRARARTVGKDVVLVCLRAKNGRTIWSKRLSSAAESGPQVVNRVLFVGTEDGNVYGLNPVNGRTIWRYQAGGPVKGGLAYSRGRVFFGDYSGNVTALRAKDGKRLWQASTSGRGFGLSGQFYGTPAVAFGRVFVGNTDGRVYSFGETTGKLAWRQSTGNYVYASAAVADVPGLGPTVYIGSYDARFYALDARSGAVRWSYRSPGRISGAASVVGKIVYFANLGHNSTIGLSARTGRKVWGRSDGGYNPVITDGIRLYLVGYAHLYALKPVSAAKHKRARAKKAHARKSTKKRRIKHRAKK